MARGARRAHYAAPGILRAFAGQAGAASRRAQAALYDYDDEDGTLMDIFKKSDILLDAIGRALRPTGALCPELELRRARPDVLNGVRRLRALAVPAPSSRASSAPASPAPATPPTSASRPCSSTPPRPERSDTWGPTDTVFFDPVAIPPVAGPSSLANLARRARLRHMKRNMYQAIVGLTTRTDKQADLIRSLKETASLAAEDVLAQQTRYCVSLPARPPRPRLHKDHLFDAVSRQLADPLCYDNFPTVGHLRAALSAKYDFEPDLLAPVLQEAMTVQPEPAASSACAPAPASSSIPALTPSSLSRRAATKKEHVYFGSLENFVPASSLEKSIVDLLSELQDVLLDDSSTGDYDRVAASIAEMYDGRVKRCRDDVHRGLYSLFHEIRRAIRERLPLDFLFG
mmetsp:Transcript_23387/g.73680  ORF Transcript_23387/g.73680 Transcript_23387/m.73680 type:complete len:401 (+) Transcript_23387:50-1252(+)